MKQHPEELLKQADYDKKTAEFLFNGGHYFYAVFMSHMSLEKALKGLYFKKLKEYPPRTHNLVFLLNKIDKSPPKTLGRFIVKLNEANVATRYPENLDKLRKEYTQSVVRDIITNSNKVLEWIKAQY